MAAYSLGSLTVNLFANSLLYGILSAIETLAPQAFGAKNYAEVGVLSVRGFIVASLSIGLVLPALLNSESLFSALDQDPETGALATEWIYRYLKILPFTVLYASFVRFLQSQEIVKPIMFISMVTAVIVHPLNLYVLVERRDSFIGSADALFASQVLVTCLLLIYCYISKPYKAETWPGLRRACKKAFCWDDTMKVFLQLSLGGILTSSEWWFWEVHCVVAGTLGVVALDIHTIPYQILPFCYMIAYGIGTALNIRVGAIIVHDVERAKLIALWTFVPCVLYIGCLCVFIYSQFDFIVGLFTKNPDVVEGCRSIWCYVCTYLFVDQLSCINKCIMKTLGLQVSAGCCIVVCCWILGLLLIIYRVIIPEGGLVALWSSLIPIYTLYNATMMISYMSLDGGKISKEIRMREGVEEYKDLLAESEYSSSTFTDQSVSLFVYVHLFKLLLLYIHP